MPAMVLFLLLLATGDAAPVVRGTLCVGESKKPIANRECSDVRGRVIAVEPEERERIFVWTSADGATVQLGTIPPKAAKIDLDAGEHAALDLSVAGEPSRGWPLDVKTTVAQQDRSWSWQLSGRGASRLRTLIVPRAPVDVTLRAEHHRTFRRSVGARSEAVKVGELKLVPLPQARGVVVDSEGHGIAGAQVLHGSGAICATANEQGAFACELGEVSRPDSGLTVLASGYGQRDVPLPPGARADVDLGRILLSQGHTLTVKVIRPEAGPGTVTLFSEIESRYEHAKVGKRDIREREDEVTFEASSGSYFVLVSGDDPLERLEVPVEVKGEDAVKTVTVEPYRLFGTVRFGEDVVNRATIGINSPEHTWRGEIPVNGGEFDTTVWQRGRMFTSIRAEELGSTPERVHMPESAGTDPTRWDIRLEKKMIVGRVFDAETKAPVSDAEMRLTAEFDGRGRFYTSVAIEKDGSYKLMSMQPGTYTLRVTSPSHVPKTLDVPVTAEDRIKTLDIALERGAVQPLEVVLASGAPARNALILEGVQPDRVNPQFMFHTDAEGRFALRGNPGESRLLYVVPQEGSLAIVRAVLLKSGEAKPLRVVVPDGVGTLRVRATRDDEPAATGLLIRYNGEFLPGAIVRFVTRSFVGTDPSGEAVLQQLPSGVYEVWAIGSREEEVAMIASGGTLRAPVRTGLSAGEAAVEVVAPPRPPGRGGE